MIDADSKRPKTRSELRKFGLTVGPAFAVLAAVFWWRGHLTPATVLGILGGSLVAGGALTPRLLGPVERFWMGLAGVLSKITTPIFMGVVYFVVLMPVGLIRRTVGNHPLRHAARDGSYWANRGEEPASDIRRQF